jgi:8-oxo-dGTP pyrophosphatase MutT (NUDIX family)
MIDLKEKIQKALSDKLPGAVSHYKLLPPGRTIKAPPADKALIKHSSVLLLLFEEDNLLKLVLIKRPGHMKHHAGQIALPGGRIEKGENAIETALRETWEEIGIPSANIEILGKLSAFYVEVSRFQIFPVVGWLSSIPSCSLCNEEVDKIIHFPIGQFKPPHSSIEIKTVTGIMEVPCVFYQKEIIWGATAMILSEFYDVLLRVPEALEA